MAMDTPTPERRDPLANLRSGYAAAAAIGAVLASGLAWAALAEVETAVDAEGTVVPVGSNRKAAHLEGGVVAEILAREGDPVQPGQVIVRIAQEQAASAVGERRARLEGLSASAARLAAEASGGAMEVPAQAGPAVRAEAAAHEAARAALAGRVAVLEEQARRSDAEARSRKAQAEGLRAQESALSRTVAMHRRAVAEGGGSPGRLAEAEAQLAGVRAQAASLPGAIEAAEAAAREARARADGETRAARAEAAAKLAQVLSEIASLEENANGAKDRLARTEVRAPARGVIHALNVADVGEVVPANATVAEIVPTGDGVLVEARVRPEDMRGLRPGMRALVRLSAYDVSRYGSLEGEVVSLAPDTTKDERTGQAWYRVRVRTAEAEVGGDAVRVGMLAAVTVVTGSRTVLDYLTSPVKEWAGEALKTR